MKRLLALMAVSAALTTTTAYSQPTTSCEWKFGKWICEQSGVDWSQSVFDPRRARGGVSGQDFVNQLYDQAARLKAGRAYTSGDLNGAANALASRGNFAEAEALKDIAAARALAAEETRQETAIQSLSLSLSLAKAINKAVADGHCDTALVIADLPGNFETAKIAAKDCTPKP